MQYFMQTNACESFGAKRDPFSPALHIFTHETLHLPTKAVHCFICAILSLPIYRQRACHAIPKSGDHSLGEHGQGPRWGRVRMVWEIAYYVHTIAYELWHGGDEPFAPPPSARDYADAFYHT